MSIKGISLLPPSVTTRQALDILQILAETNKNIGMLRSEFSHSIVNDFLISVFSLQESVQSTRIEGTQVTFQEMLEPNSKKDSWERQEVINYQNALKIGTEKIRNGEPISTRLIKELHSILMSNNARGTSSGQGKFRKIQNFIGPDNKIEHAVYIPIPANEIDEYMTNLEYYINGIKHSSFKVHDKDLFIFDELTDPLIKTAILHAQFESIHPFLDGNGRIGRILIALYAIKSDIVDVPIFLVSEELEKERLRYYDLLNGIRGDKPDWYNWIKFFITSSNRVAKRLIRKLQKAERLANLGLEKIKLQSEKTVWLYTFSHPITTVALAKKDLQMSASTIRASLNNLTSKGLLYKNTSIKRNQSYNNYDLLRIIS